VVLVWSLFTKKQQGLLVDGSRREACLSLYWAGYTLDYLLDVVFGCFSQAFRLFLLKMASKEEENDAIMVRQAVSVSELSTFTPGSPGRSDYVAPDTPSQARRKKALEEEAQKQIERIQSHKDSILSNPDEERCLICMNAFTKRQPPYKIPCSHNCNDTAVHEKCIYEWKERQQGHGSCPLCRAPLNEMSYVPPDALRSATFHIFAARKDFVTRPVDPKVGMIRCYLRVTKVGFTGIPMGYEIYLQAPSILAYPLGPMPRAQGPAPGDQLLIVAKKKFAGLTRGQIDVTLDRNGKDFDREGQNYLGSILSSFIGLDHVGVVPCEDSPTRVAEVMCVQYSQNRLGRGVGPRKMRVAFPACTVDPNGRNTVMDEDDDDDFDEDFDNRKAPKFRMGMNISSNRFDTLLHYLKENTEYISRTSARGSQSRSSIDQEIPEYSPPKDILFGRNKEPYWLESIMAYSLDFHGRVTLPSNKNFILMLPAGSRPPNTAPVLGDTADANVCMQFGKVEEILNECYTLDVCYPLSVLQAAMIALSACDRKLACA